MLQHAMREKVTATQDGDVMHRTDLNADTSCMSWKKTSSSCGMRGFTCCRPSESKASMKLRSATTASTRTCKASELHLCNAQFKASLKMRSAITALTRTCEASELHLCNTQRPSQGINEAAQCHHCIDSHLLQGKASQLFSQTTVVQGVFDNAPLDTQHSIMMVITKSRASRG